MGRTLFDYAHRFASAKGDAEISRRILDEYERRLRDAERDLVGAMERTNVEAFGYGERIVRLVPAYGTRRVVVGPVLPNAIAVEVPDPAPSPVAAPPPPAEVAGQDEDEDPGRLSLEDCNLEDLDGRLCWLPGDVVGIPDDGDDRYSALVAASLDRGHPDEGHADAPDAATRFNPED
jgi:hypothetical protein